jgi:hypothetical protein
LGYPIGIEATQPAWTSAGAGLPAVVPVAICRWMFMVSEEDAAAIRAAFDQGGELSAAIELRRLFPGIGDYAKARECARAIVGWKPPPHDVAGRSVEG